CSPPTSPRDTSESDPNRSNERTPRRLHAPPPRSPSVRATFSNTDSGRPSRPAAGGTPQPGERSYGSRHRRGASMAHRVVSANQQLSRLIRVLAPHTLLLARASAQHDRPALVVGGVTSVGYLGFMFGP